MQAVLDQFTRYLHEALGVTVVLNPWKEGRLPHFLRETYRFYEVDLLGTRCLLMLDRSSTEQTPASLRKHIRLVQATRDVEVIYVRSQLTTYNRKRLIEQKVPFVIPGNQMYLPLLGIDLREHFRRLRSPAVTLSPSAQALLLHALLRADNEVLTPKKMATRLGYSAMTMSRAFDELRATNIGEISAHGKERHLRFLAKPQDTWTKAQPFLRSPVDKRICIERVEAATRGPRAGLSALAEYTMLAAPARATYAVSRKDWQSLRQHHKVIEIPDQDPEALMLEVWSYSPAKFSDGDLVDPLSLYLSLEGSDDERIVAALEELKGKMRW